MVALVLLLDRTLPSVAMRPRLRLAERSSAIPLSLVVGSCTRIPFPRTCTNKLLLGPAPTGFTWSEPSMTLYFAAGAVAKNARAALAATRAECMASATAATAGVTNNVLTATRAECMSKATAALAASIATAALATFSLATTIIAAPLATAALGAAVATAAVAATVISVAVTASAATASWATLAKVLSVRAPALPSLPMESQESFAWGPPPAGFDWGMAS